LTSLSTLASILIKSCVPKTWLWDRLGRQLGQNRLMSASWFALRVRAQHERVAATLLQYKGYEVFLPLYKSMRSWSDRSKEVHRPLFPGYVFWKCDSNNAGPLVLSTPGVLGIVRAGRTPLPVDSEEVKSLQSIDIHALAAQPWPYIRAGDRVRIEYGPLAGLEGVLVRADNAARILLSVTLLRRSVAIQVDASHLRPVREVSFSTAATAVATANFSA